MDTIATATANIAALDVMGGIFVLLAIAVAVCVYVPPVRDRVYKLAINFNADASEAMDMVSEQKQSGGEAKQKGLDLEDAIRRAEEIAAKRQADKQIAKASKSASRKKK